MRYPIFSLLSFVAFFLATSSYGQVSDEDRYFDDPA
jgi:hypothetical protein